jgi:DNA-binding response OmpR family regulator
MNYTALGPILIVEDDRKTVALLSLYFRREGFKTIVAHDGQQALDLAP